MEQVSLDDEKKRDVYGELDDDYEEMVDDDELYE